MSTIQTEVTPTEAITLTEGAASKVAELVEQEGNPDLALRVAVRPGGCSGFSYEMFFDTDVADDDQVSQFGTVKVVVDPASASLLQGSTLDFKDGLAVRSLLPQSGGGSRLAKGFGSDFSRLYSMRYRPAAFRRRAPLLRLSS